MNNLKIPTQYKSFKLIRPISWQEIFDSWKEGEAYQESWKKHWEERGFNSWEDWRTAHIASIQPQNLEWFLFEIQKPLDDIVEIYGAPTRRWIAGAYQGKMTKKLKDITSEKLVTENDKIIAIKKNFPKQVLLFGLINDQKIVLCEGMHRSCAMATWDFKIPFESKVYIALSSWNSELPVAAIVSSQ